MKISCSKSPDGIYCGIVLALLFLVFGCGGQGTTVSGTSSNGSGGNTSSTSATGTTTTTGSTTTGTTNGSSRFSGSYAGEAQNYFPLAGGVGGVSGSAIGNITNTGQVSFTGLSMGSKNGTYMLNGTVAETGQFVGTVTYPSTNGVFATREAFNCRFTEPSKWTVDYYTTSTSFGRLTFIMVKQ